jgi:hypothetical protein
MPKEGEMIMNAVRMRMFVIIFTILTAGLSQLFGESLVSVDLRAHPSAECLNCGDANSDGAFNISDMVFLISYLFAGGTAPDSCGGNPIGIGNADGCGIVTISDVYTIMRKFSCEGSMPSGCENTLPCQKTVRGVVRVGNPPYAVGSGNTVAIPIYITTDFPLAAYSLGFTCPSSNIELTSIDYSGSQVNIAKGTGGVLQNGSQILAGTVLHCANTVTYNDALLFKVNARILQGCPYQAFLLDSAFVPPGGEFVLIGENGEQYSPEFIPNDPICTGCGDANGDCAINISDAVSLITYIFLPFPITPGDCNYPKGLGDANGDVVVNISDAVYLIAYIFAGGAAPHCQGM